jgi:hypothetical protein
VQPVARASQLDPAVGPVVPHGQQHGGTGRAVVEGRTQLPRGAEDPAGARADQRRRVRRQPRDVQAAHQLGQVLGVATLLKDEPLLLGDGAGVQERRGGDRRAVARLGRLTQAVAEAEEVAVARVAVPEGGRQVGQGPVLVAAAQQQLGRAKGARADEHVPGRHLALDALAAGARVAVLTQADPVAVTGAGDVDRFGPGGDGRAVLLSQGQVVQVQGVLGALVAADVALAGEGAGSLGDPEPVGPFALEPHGQVGVEEAVALPQELGGLGHEPRLGRQLAGSRVGGHRLDIEHVGDQVVVRLECRPAVRLGPGPVEDLLGRPHGDVGVDQQPAAVAGRLHGEDVVERPCVVQALVAQPQPAVVEPGQVAGKAPGRPAPAALDHRDVHPSLGEPAHRHRAAEAAADDQGLELVAAQVLGPGPRRGHPGSPSAGGGRRTAIWRASSRCSAAAGWRGVLPAMAARSIHGSCRSAGLGWSHSSTDTPPGVHRTRTWEWT